MKSLMTLYKVEDPQDYSHTGWASINPDRFTNTMYENNVTTEQVQAVHLMKVIKDTQLKSLDLLQIDTEGYEFNILKGLTKQLLKKINFRLKDYYAGEKHTLIRSTHRIVWEYGQFWWLFASNTLFRH